MVWKEDEGSPAEGRRFVCVVKFSEKCFANGTQLSNCKPKHSPFLLIHAKSARPAKLQLLCLGNCKHLFLGNHLFGQLSLRCKNEWPQGKWALQLFFVALLKKQSVNAFTRREVAQLTSCLLISKNKSDFGSPTKSYACASKWVLHNLSGEHASWFR